MHSQVVSHCTSAAGGATPKESSKQNKLTISKPKQINNPETSSQLIGKSLE